MKIKITTDLLKKIDNLNEQHKDGLDKGVMAFLNSLKNSIVAGKLSGNPVRRRTGNLVNSIDYKKISEDEYELGSFGVKYAWYLENSPRLEKYRWLKTGVKEGLDEAEKQLEIVLNSMLKKVH